MTKPSGSPKSFESAIAELESIVEEMEGSTISLEDGLARYQRGVTLLKYCRNTLTDAEQRILKLEGDTLIDSGDQEA
jgi:exodeoxyribonuclease VII small subunit